jgi:transposase InsO family protein
MVVDPRLLAFIQEVRETYGRVGKEKLKVLVDAYAQALGIPTYGATKLGKIVKRHHYFFDAPKHTKRLRFQRKHIKHAPKVTTPGYIEMDSVHIMVSTTKLVFITVIDVATKVAYAELVRGATSQCALAVFQHFCAHYHLRVQTVQTDNGSEFLGDFHDYLETEQVPHLFSYPRSPRINGVIERFNRTLQEEHVERTDEWWYDRGTANKKLTLFLQWYNEVRPHAALKYQAPLVYLQTFT